MERLTYRLKTGEVLMATEYEEKYTKDEWIGMLQCCLAAYEDTRLAPEEVDKLAKDWNDLCTVLGECGGISRLRELAEADEDGRVVVLPCKVGDKLYRVFDGNISEHEVQNMKYFARQGRLGIDMTPFFPDAEKFIGKTVFLTREEAEKALEAMKDE